MNWEDLIGVWKYPSSQEPSGYGWFVFLEGGRFFRAVWERSVEKFVPLRSHVTMESPHELGFRGVTGKSTCSTHGCWFVGESIILTNAAGAYICERVPQEKVPGWFVDELRQAIASWPS